MSAGKGRTVLDLLELEGVVDGLTAADLRRIASRKPAPLSQSEAASLQLLLYGLLKPARPDSRLALDRNFAIAFEHAYYVSLGDPAATLKTAKLWGLSRRTISNALREHPMKMEPDSRRSSELRKVFAATRKQFQSARLGNKTR